MRNKTIFFIITCLCIACRQEKEYFYGNIHTYEFSEPVEMLTGKEIEFDSVQTGFMYVHDSLIFFESTLLPRYSIYAFNAKNGKYLFGLFGRGQGPMEYINVSCAGYKRLINGQTHIYFNATNEQKIIDVNIDKLTAHLDQPDSIKAAITTSEFLWSTLHTSPYIPVFPLDEQRILAKSMFETPYMNTKNPLLPQYELIDRESNTITKSFPIFAHQVRPEEPNDLFYLTSDAIHPNGKKVVMAMWLVPQINILDIETGQMDCFRLKGAQGMEYLERCAPERVHLYYKHVTADSKYIYALYVDKPYFQERDSDPASTSREIHVFDWNGNFIRRLKIKERAYEIHVDENANLLYAPIYKTDKVFVYSLNQ